MIRSIAFTVYRVTDVHRAQEFYENLLGLHLDSNFGDQWLEYDVGGDTFAITTMYGKPPSGDRGTIAFEVEDIDQTAARLKAAKTVFTHDVFDTPVCRMAMIADPDGNEIIIHQRKSA